MSRLPFDLLVSGRDLREYRNLPKQTEPPLTSPRSMPIVISTLACLSGNSVKRFYAGPDGNNLFQSPEDTFLRMRKDYCFVSFHCCVSLPFGVNCTTWVFVLLVPGGMLLSSRASPLLRLMIL